MAKAAGSDDSNRPNVGPNRILRWPLIRRGLCDAQTRATAVGFYPSLTLRQHRT